MEVLGNFARCLCMRTGAEEVIVVAEADTATAIRDLLGTGACRKDIAHARVTDAYGGFTAP